MERLEPDDFWDDLFDDENQLDRDEVVRYLDERDDYGGAEDGFGNVVSDADPGL